ncbi:hypothetical protein ES705_09362 [subsurface metagenome]
MRAISIKQSVLKTIELKCGKCGKKFYTKNIEYVGARHIFAENNERTSQDGDCGHGIDDLEIVEPKEIDIESFKKELKLFHGQGRSHWDIERIFKMNYGKTPEEFGLKNKGVKEEREEGIAVISEKH